MLILDGFCTCRRDTQNRDSPLRERKERLRFPSRVPFVGQGCASEGTTAEVFDLVSRNPDTYLLHSAQACIAELVNVSKEPKARRKLAVIRRISIYNK